MGIADKTVIDWNNYMQEICALERDENGFQSVLKEIAKRFPPKK